MKKKVIEFVLIIGLLFAASFGTVKISAAADEQSADSGISGAVSSSNNTVSSPTLCKSQYGYNMSVDNYYDYMQRYENTERKTTWKYEDGTLVNMTATCTVEDGVMKVVIIKTENNNMKSGNEWFGITVSKGTRVNITSSISETEKRYGGNSTLEYSDYDGYGDMYFEYGYKNGMPSYIRAEDGYGMLNISDRYGNQLQEYMADCYWNSEIKSGDTFTVNCGDTVKTVQFMY